MNSQEKEEKVYNIFQTIAENYDGANLRISLGMQNSWKKHLTNAAILDAEIKSYSMGSGAEFKALDVCTGTGDIAMELAKKYQVWALDFSPAMLDVAKRRSAKRFLKNKINWVQGSALELPFEDSSFDVAAISFGLRNTSDFAKVLSEMKRVIKPGGHVYVLDSFEPEKGFVYPFYKFYFGKIVPFAEGILGFKEEYKWLNQSTEMFVSLNELIELFDKTGLKDVCDRSFLFGACCMVSGVK